MTKARKSLVIISILAFGGAALAASDAEVARLITRDGAQLGWSARVIPPDPIIPNDKAVADLKIDTDTRTDLDQQVVLRHTEAGTIHPCIRVFHHWNANGDMSEVVNFLDGDDNVRITVPDGYEIVRKPNGSYTVAAIDR